MVFLALYKRRSHPGAKQNTIGAPKSIHGAATADARPYTVDTPAEGAVNFPRAKPKLAPV